MGNRGQTCLPVGLKVIGRIRGSQKPRPRLVQASISSLHHGLFVVITAITHQVRLYMLSRIQKEAGKRPQRHISLHLMFDFLKLPI